MMKIKTIEHNKLLAGLEACNLVESSKYQPILQNIKVTGDSLGSIHLTGFDLDSYISVNLTGSHGLSTFEYLMPRLSIKKLSNKAFKGEEASISLEAGNLAYSCNDRKLSLTVGSIEDYPIYEPNLVANNWDMLDLDISAIDTLNKIASHASTYDTCNILGGINIQSFGNVIECAGTDGNRLANSVIGKTIYTENKLDITVRTRQIKRLVKIAKLFSLDSLKLVYNGKEAIFIGAFEGGNIILSDAILEGMYPRYKQLIPSDCKQVASYNKKALLSALKECKDYVNSITNLVSITKDNITAKEDGEAYTINIGAVLDNDTDYGFAMNYKYLVNSLDILDGDNVTLKYISATSPIVVTSKDSDIQSLVMPIKQRV